MAEWIITSTVLAALVIAARYALRGRISLRLQYGLWLLVLVRLLVPVSFGGTAVSVANAAHVSAAETLPEDEVMDEVSTESEETSKFEATAELARIIDK